MNIIQKIVYSVIGLMIVFILLSTLILPQFETSYTTFGYCLAQGSLITCSDCNNTDTNSVGYKTLKNNCYGLVGSQNNTHCYGCANWGFRDVSRGLQLLVLSLALIGMAILYIFKKKKI